MESDLKLDHTLCDFCGIEKKVCDKCGISENKEEIIKLFANISKNINEKYALREELNEKLDEVNRTIRQYESFVDIIRFWDSEDKLNSKIRYCLVCGKEIEKSIENISKKCRGYQCCFCESNDKSYICNCCSSENKKNNLNYCSICGRVVE